MLGFAILSLALMFVDHLSNYLDEVRSGLTVLVTPIVIVADYPSMTAEVIQEVLTSRDDLQERNRELERELLILNVKTEKMAALTAENNRLRNLLGSAAKLQDKVLISELVGVDPDPAKHEVIIDKGSRNQVFNGQPVVDARGLIGQVIEVGPLTSRVLLINDQSHSVPVQVVRNNLRFIAKGTGVTRQLELMFVHDTADIREGDLLVSSGLGDRFPVGYPVGVVNKVEHDPAKSFATATATPSALLNRSRYVLLVFTEKRLSKAPAINGNRRDG